MVWQREGLLPTVANNRYVSARGACWSAARLICDAGSQTLLQLS
jgi:hypothetical protein